jgi:hypothetical protein
MVVSTRKNRWFVKCEPPSDAAMAAVLQKISPRVIRTLRRLGYLEAGTDAAVATTYDPLLDNEPRLARTMAASVTQRIAFGNGLERRCAASARALAMQENGRHSRDLAVPVCTAFPCTPTPRFRRIGVVSWSV